MPADAPSPPADSGQPSAASTPPASASASASATPPVSAPSPAPGPSVDEVEAQVLARINARIKDLTGDESLDTLQTRIMRERGEHDKIAAQRTAEMETWKQKYQVSQIRQALVEAAIDANAIDPPAIFQFLGDKGKLVGDEVRIDGKTPAEAVKALLKEKTYLVKPTGNQGSGAAAVSAEDEIAREAERIANLHKAHLRQVR